MDGLDRATLGVRLKLGQKLQGETFEMSELHTNLVTLQVSPCPNYPSDRLDSFTSLDIYLVPTCTKIFNFLGPFKGF